MAEKRLLSIKVNTKGAERKANTLRDIHGRFLPTTSLIVNQVAEQLVSMYKQYTPRATGTLANSTSYVSVRSHGQWQIRISQPVLSKSGIPINILVGFNIK